VPEAVAYSGSCVSLECSSGGSFPYDARALKALASLKGPVMTDIPDLLLLGASPELEDPAFMVLMPMQFNGRFDDRRLLADVERQRFVALALDRQLLDRDWRGVPFFWPRLHRALMNNYASVSMAGPPFIMIRKRDAAFRKDFH
jgi:hypothetical protein